MVDFDSLTDLADVYKMAIAASVAKTTNTRDKKTQTFVGDCIKMVKFCADDDQVDKTTMDELSRTLHKRYDDVTKQLKDSKAKESIPIRKKPGNTRRTDASSIS